MIILYYYNRDFRRTKLATNGNITSQAVTWTSTQVLAKTKVNSTKTYVVNYYVPKPTTAVYVGFYLEVNAVLINSTIVNAIQTPFTFTTEVNIIPDQYPVADCFGPRCKGKLI